MRHLIETMESRTLLSASAAVIAQDLVTLNNDRIRAAADLKAALATLSADAKAIKAAVIATRPTKAQKSELAAAQKDQKRGVGIYKKEANALLKRGTKAGKSVYSLLKKLSAHPNNAALRPKIAKAMLKLMNTFSTQAIAKVEGDLTTLITGVQGDLTALATDVPAASGAINTLQSHLSADQTTLATDLSTIQTGVTRLATDLA